VGSLANPSRAEPHARKVTVNSRVKARLSGTIPTVGRFSGIIYCMTLNIGDTAPDFTIPDQNGDPVALSKLRGKPVVLYFYPKANTPGCTTQACGVRDHKADYAKLGATVLGVSPDPVKPIAKFVDKFDLGFTLLSDEGHAVAEQYGVWVEKSMYGRTYLGNERTTFVIGPDGVITHVFRKVKPAEHDAMVLAALAA
jgi:thioredoxin-dependent peroxiredoxin